jgi:hypothetical protein
MASITSATKARLQASDLVSVITTDYQSRYEDAPMSEVYTFTCGYLESMLAGIMADHPSIRKEVSERVASMRARMLAKGTFV